MAVAEEPTKDQIEKAKDQNRRTAHRELLLMAVKEVIDNSEVDWPDPHWVPSDDPYFYFYQNLWCRFLPQGVVQVVYCPPHVGSTIEREIKVDYHDFDQVARDMVSAAMILFLHPIEVIKVIP